MVVQLVAEAGLPAEQDRAVGMERLVAAVQELSLSRTLDEIMVVVRRAARELTKADGATFVLREDGNCFYADENAIAPLWKGKRFPLSTCISGWAMLHREPVVVPDIYKDDRIPVDAYRPTFVKSLVMVPIRTTQPVGAIGNYWATPHVATAEEVRLLQALADSTSVALENVRLLRETEQRLQQAQESLRTRDEFIDVASHELRTPLTSLLLELQLLRKSVMPGEQAAVDRALGSSRRLSNLVELLIDTSSISVEGLQLSREPVELVALVREQFSLLYERARRAASKVTLLADAPIEGHWDRTRLRQVVNSLLGNALKFGAGAPVEIAIEAGPARARLIVRDHGKGIPQEDLARIFDRFERASPVRSYGGLGLGLFISRRIVEAHGGSIAVESAPGIGATFTVDLPRG
jgi:signal transduction histidine kinase